MTQTGVRCLLGTRLCPIYVVNCNLIPGLQELWNETVAVFLTGRAWSALDINHDLPPCSPEHLLVLTQQHQYSSSQLLTQQTRAKVMMQKSHSQGDSIDLVLGGRSGSYQRPPRVHQYEEIRPKLVYADIDHTPQVQNKTHTLH